MTRLHNDARRFSEEALRGFAAAHARHVQPVHGGVVRATASPPGQVAVVLGGGSGHYPAFAGWVGPGMAHGAACGNVFASPAAGQVYSVARTADNGGGVLLGFGNYAGDVLHFGLAAERLRAEGVDVRTVAVTDDLASAPATAESTRRGIAGDLLVFKVAGAAAAAGLDLDAVETVTRRANARTRSLGVAFDGCSLPGAGQPLFTVPAGAMALGLGIHGEPGLEELPLGSADDVADRLVDGVLREAPDRGPDGYDGRVAVLLNGLGGTKYEELFVVYVRVADRLAQAGLSVVDPVVGEQVTSLDMAGLSLSVMYLDDELERYWTAPVDTPAFTRDGEISTLERRPPVEARTEVAAATGHPDSHWLAGGIARALRAMADTAEEHERAWGDLDAVAGDGDHGQGIVLGTRAAARRADELLAAGVGAKTLLIAAGDAWSEGAGGTSGALWGAALTALGGSLSDEGGAGRADLVRGARNGAEAVLRLGGARVGDKTMVDAVVPFVDALEDHGSDGESLAAAWRQAATAAAEAADRTAELLARRGRARTHGERTRGHPDPGAVSFAGLMQAVATVLAELDKNRKDTP